MNNGTYTLKGSQPFVVNNATLGAGVSSFSGTCITSLTDATGCPGIINHPFSAGAINNGSSMVLVNAIPSAITSNTAASSGGGITYRWVRSGTSSTTYTVNNAGHSFTAAEVNTAGTWTYYREVRDNTCATTTWNRSSGSYVLTVINCPYQGSDLYIDATHLCQQRASGAQNWEAWIKDARDSKLYRIILMPDNKWWLAQNVKYAGVGSAITGCTEDECGRQYTWEQVYASYAGGSSGSSGNVQGICPSGWLLPVTYNYTTLTNLIGDETTICQRLRAQTSPCTPRIDYYGWASVRSTCNGEDLNAGDAWYANDTNREDGLIIDLAHNGSGLQCNKIYQHLVQAAHRASVRCFRQL
jgi:uncharacterized protein (TIGR02145 family)